MQNNTLLGSLPQTLQSLRKMLCFSIHSNRIAGSIPDGACASRSMVTMGNKQTPPLRQPPQPLEDSQLLLLFRVACQIARGLCDVKEGLISWSHDKTTPWERAQGNFLEVSCLLRDSVFPCLLYFEGRRTS